MFGNGPSILTAFDEAGSTFVPTDAKASSTPQLVRAYGELKVWFAVNEVTGPTKAGNRKHAQLCVVVDELRARGVLD